MNRALLKEYGIDCELGIERCLGKEALYEKLLRMFLRDDTLERARAARESGDREALFLCAHELKGTSGNVSIQGLYEASSALVDYLRGGGDDAGVEAGLFAAMEKACAHAREGISRM